jgi:hypothetical protein
MPVEFLPYQPHISLNETIHWIGRHAVQIPDDVARRIEDFGLKWEVRLTFRERRIAQVFPAETKLANLFRRGVVAGNLFMTLSELKTSGPIWRRIWPGTDQAIRLGPDECIRALSMLESIAQDARMCFWDIVTEKRDFDPAMRINCPSTFSQLDCQWLGTLCFETKEIFTFLDPGVVDKEEQGSQQAAEVPFRAGRDPEAPRSRVVQSEKTRHNELDAAIEEAIKDAGGAYGTPVVFEKLRILALQEMPPFTGMVDAVGLHYTDHQNNPACINKSKLESRLNRRWKALGHESARR